MLSLTARAASGVSVGDFSTLVSTVSSASSVNVSVNLTFTDIAYVTEEVSITGQVSGVEFDGDGTWQHFIVSGSSANLTLTSLTLKNGYTLTQGGAVRVIDGATLIASAVMFYDSDALSSSRQDGAGGAVYVANYSYFSASECYFEDNSADTGGSVYVTGGSTFVTNDCDFTGNSASSSVSTSSLIGPANLATIAGGAIVIEDESVLEATDTSFDQNECAGNGGALYVSNSTARLTSVSFEENVVDFGQGGGVYLTGVSVMVCDGCVFDSNQADSKDNDLYVVSSADIARGSVYDQANLAVGGETDNVDFSDVPSAAPTPAPSGGPTYVPSPMPSADPTEAPSEMPTTVPSPSPSFAPSIAPSEVPTTVPTPEPSLAPSIAPSEVETKVATPMSR